LFRKTEAFEEKKKTQLLGGTRDITGRKGSQPLRRGEKGRKKDYDNGSITKRGGRDTERETRTPHSPPQMKETMLLRLEKGATMKKEKPRRENPRMKKKKEKRGRNLL